MPTGLLEVSGSIDIAQMWPDGTSDADTLKVKLSGANAFRFQPHPDLPAKVTHAFDGATIKGKTRKPAVDKKGQLTIRLQGIDAPELHYRPLAPTLNGKKPSDTQRASFNKANGDFRQHYGETAAVALHGCLAKAGSSTIKCVVRTAVDEPGDVFDTFGRFIGDVFITVRGKEQNVNHWLCENGWAYPTFYSSMTNDEITTLIKLSEKARTKKAGLWKKASASLTGFDRSLLFRSHGEPDPAADVGALILPKLFRRLSTYSIAKIARMTSANFKSYLQMEPDRCYKTDEFMKLGLTVASQHHLDEFITPGSKFTVGAKDLVFKEDPSEVIGKNGKPATW